MKNFKVGSATKKFSFVDSMNTFQTKLNFKQRDMYSYTTFMGFHALSNIPICLNSEENSWTSKH